MFIKVDLNNCITKDFSDDAFAKLLMNGDIANIPVLDKVILWFFGFKIIDYLINIIIKIWGVIKIMFAIFITMILWQFQTRFLIKSRSDKFGVQDK